MKKGLPLWIANDQNNLIYRMLSRKMRLALRTGDNG